MKNITLKKPKFDQSLYQEIEIEELIPDDFEYVLGLKQELNDTAPSTEKKAYSLYTRDGKRGNNPEPGERQIPISYEPESIQLNS